MTRPARPDLHALAAIVRRRQQRGEMARASLGPLIGSVAQQSARTAAEDLNGILAALGLPYPNRLPDRAASTTLGAVQLLLRVQDEITERTAGIVAEIATRLGGESETAEEGSTTGS